MGQVWKLQSWWEYIAVPWERRESPPWRVAFTTRESHDKVEITGGSVVLNGPEISLPALFQPPMGPVGLG